MTTSTIRSETSGPDSGSTAHASAGVGAAVALAVGVGVGVAVGVGVGDAVATAALGCADGVAVDPTAPQPASARTVTSASRVRAGRRVVRCMSPSSGLGSTVRDLDHRAIGEPGQHVGGGAATL
jgi:hypothetical protein